MIDALIALAFTSREDLPATALFRAEFSLRDWLACGLAGRNEPLAKNLRALAAHEGGAGHASLLGGGAAPARMAALVNGAASHALDYDDTHFAHVGHLSVGIYPAAFALAEELDRDMAACVAAFLVGAEAATRIGSLLGSEHYNRGFHQTATAGAFGATIAAGRLLGLTSGQMRHALGLCATRASGLKSQFGTMGKPYNAGIAAANGVECARLAALGFTSASDGLFGSQGFFETHHARAGFAQGSFDTKGARFQFEDNLYKMHACCHGLHAMIEALKAAVPTDLELGAVDRVTVRTNPRWLRVCDNKTPRTGLETKFSYAWLAGMTLRGDATGDPNVYSDACADDAELKGFAARVDVSGDDTLSDLQVAGAISFQSGQTLTLWHDLQAAVADHVLRERLAHKATALLGPDARTLWEFDLAATSARDVGRIVREWTDDTRH